MYKYNVVKWFVHNKDGYREDNNLEVFDSQPEALAHITKMYADYIEGKEDDGQPENFSELYALIQGVSIELKKDVTIVAKSRECES